MRRLLEMVSRVPLNGIRVALSPSLSQAPTPRKMCSWHKSGTCAFKNTFLIPVKYNFIMAQCTCIKTMFSKAHVPLLRQEHIFVVVPIWSELLCIISFISIHRDHFCSSFFFSEIPLLRRWRLPRLGAHGDPNSYSSGEENLARLYDMQPSNLASHRKKKDERKRKNRHVCSFNYARLGFVVRKI